MNRNDLISKTVALGRFDTKTYRYQLAGNKVKRIKRKYLDTTYSLSDMDAYNPNGWQTIATL